MLPQYEITGILGRGGMGAVYKGRQAKLNRTVAIKVLPETFSKGDDELNFAKRFEQEAQAMAGLDHPAIISVHDFGETAQGQLYFVMEFVDGMDIHQYLTHHGGRLPQESALAICAHVLDALGYAHSQGIVHRDIKPANILLNREGRVKIADFGLAKKFGEHADSSAPALTMSNVAVGTPDFVAPEALDSGQTPDHRADLYAVGVMLYQMLTGKLPRGSFQPPSALVSEIDPRLDGIVTKATAADPDYRYASAAAMRADLDLVLSQPMTRIEPGVETEAVPVAVPVTTSVKGGGKTSAPTRKGSSAGVPKRSQAVPMPAKGGNTALIAGLSMAAAVAIGVGAFWIFRPDREPAVAPPVVAQAKQPTTEDAEAGKPVPAPNPSTVPAVVQNDPQPPAKAPTPELPIPATPTAPAPAKSDPTPPEKPPVAMPEPPKTPAPAVPTPPQAPPTPAPDPAVARLAALPGLKIRLESYLAARAKQTGDLAAKYLGGLQPRLDQAANAGDLRLATAFSDEKARVESLQKALGVPPADPLAAAADASAGTLPALPEGSPAPLATLRQTWTTESDKIHTTLDAALRQSLQALESELTKGRDFENAKAVLAWREGLAKGTPAPGAMAAVANPALPATTPSPPGSSPTPATQGTSAGADPVLSRATKKEPFVNSLGMKFVPVPDTGILLCIHETKKGDYAKFAAENPGAQDRWRNPSELGLPVSEGDDHPVVDVNWNDAKAFCAWLSQKENRTYRLPTDREWSEAAGIAREEKEGLTPEELLNQTIDQYPWGTDWPPPKNADNYGDTSLKEKLPDRIIIEGDTDGYATTAPVMSFRADRLGLFDIGGNVSEWCEDWFNADQKYKVDRGSNWSTRWGPMFFLSHRGNRGPVYGLNYVGFRCALVVSPSHAAPETALPAAPKSAPPSAAKTAAPVPALASATKDQPFENSLGMKFVPVPGTDSLFCIHETRLRDYASHAAERKLTTTVWKAPVVNGVTLVEGDDHPVSGLFVREMEAFCRWLSEREGLAYRLTADREWSFAVGIGREEQAGARSRKLSASPWWGWFWKCEAIQMLVSRT